MGDNEDGHAAAGQIHDDVQHFLHHFRVQGGGRLIKEHHLRVHGQGTDDGQTLLLTAGELPGVLVGLFLQAHPAQQGQGLFLGLGLGYLLLQYRRQGHIVKYRHVGEHVKILKHHAHALAELAGVQLFVGDVLALEVDLSLGGLLQQVQAAEKGGLAAAGGADDGDHFATADGGGNALEHLQVAEALFQVFGADDLISHWRSASFQARAGAGTE